MKSEKYIILKTLVGSQAHGIADENSDYDYRGVYVRPTSEILKLGAKQQNNSWFEGRQDQVMYEVGHFLHLATKCNPSILEVFVAPVLETDYGVFGGKILRELFPYVWNPKDAFNAFVGYSSSQRKKMLDKKDNRGPKFACAYLRSLYNLEDLLKTEKFSLDVTSKPNLYKRLRDIRNGDFKIGEVIDEAEEKIEECKILRDKCNHEPDIEKVNNFLLNVRQVFW